MSRQFDTAAGTDSITFSVGNAPPDQGPITIGVLAKATSTAGWTGWMARGLKAGTPVWGMLTTNNAGPKLFAENDFGNGVAGLSTSWRWYVMTKVSGSAAPRFHVWDLSGAWSHTDNSATVGDGTGPIDTIYVGSQTGSANGWRGSIAVVATFTSALSDGAIESAFALSAANLLAGSPGWMIRLNQASTATSITDDTGGGGSQTAISGTSVDADDPPGFSYSLNPTFTGTVSMGAVQALSLAGQLTLPGITSMGVTQALSLAGISSMPAPFATAVDLTLDGTVTAGTETSAGWETIRGAINEARAQHLKHQERRRRPIDCPVHLWPLEIVGNTYHCKFGGHVVRLPAPSP